MLKSRQRFKLPLLSPGISIITALMGAAIMIGRDTSSIWVLLISVAAAALITVEIKARKLFRGPNFPFAGFFMLLQAVMPQNITGCCIALFVALTLILAIANFMNGNSMRLIFTIMLACGAAAMWWRPFLLIVPVMLLIFLMERALSLRGFVAAALGLIAAAILLFASGLADIETVLTAYSEPLFTFKWPVADHSMRAAIVSTAIAAALTNLIMFLPSYGYPAAQRTANMSTIALTGCALLLGFVIDFGNVMTYMPLLNLCTAYQMGHICATKPGGTILAACFWTGIIVLMFI